MKIIGITGKARSGKDTLAEYLVEHHGFLKLSFAEPIRRFVSDITGHSVEDLADGPLKEENLGWIDTTPRRLMQTVGTEWGRQMVDPDLWLKVAHRRIRDARRAGVPGIVISDVRFNNEAEFVRRWDGEVIRIERPGVEAVAAHASEAGVSDDLVDLTIVNDRERRYLALWAADLAAE